MAAFRGRFERHPGRHLVRAWQRRTRQEGIVAGVQHRAFDVHRAQGPGQPLGLGDVLRAEQNGLTRGVDLGHVRDDARTRQEFLSLTGGRRG